MFSFEGYLNVGLSGLRWSQQPILLSVGASDESFAVVMQLELYRQWKLEIVKRSHTR
jgi:hypothetical protein